MAELLPEMVRADILPVVLCLRKRQEEGIEEEVVKKGFDVRFIPGSSFFSKVLNLRKFLRKEKPDLIHSSLFQANLITRFAALGLPVAVLSSIVNTPYEKVRFEDPDISPARLRTVRQIDAWTSRHLTTHFHAVSNFAKSSAMKNLGIPGEQITVIERGRDPSRLGLPSLERRRCARQQLGLSEKKIVITNIGRHDYQKGQKYLLQTIPGLAQKYPEIVLLIAGRKGTSSAELERIRENLGLEEKVRFLGHCQNIPDILAATDLFVFPSLFEGLPGAILEAMALGLPLVASDIPSNREVLEEGKNALLVAPKSTAALSAAMDTLLADESLCRKFGQRSREIFEERFTIGRSGSRMIKLYQDIIATKQDGAKNGKGSI